MTTARTGATAVVTIVANNYLHFARTLMQSVAQAMPAADRYCVLADRDRGLLGEFEAEMRPLHYSELGLPGGEAFAFQYGVMELCTAVKPWALERLLERGYERVIYLDPDIFVYLPLDAVIERLDNGCDLVLTPHLLAPVTDLKKPGELDIRQSGTYNLGFCALRASANARAILAWWQGKLEHDCVVDLRHGIFVDQSWMDLVPGLFPNVAILRDPGCNVAYWNLAQRPLQRDAAGGWRAAASALTFFHFSGFDPVRPEGFSRHQDRFLLVHLGEAAQLALDYAARVLGNGLERFAALPFGFAGFADGTPIPASFRRMYRGNPEVRARLGPDPFGQPDALRLPAGEFGIRWHFERRERTDLPLLSGLSVVESNVADEGVWVSRRFSVWFPRPPGRGLTLRGAYFPQAIELACGRREAALSIWWGDRHVHRQELAEQGDFELELDLPSDGEGAAALLRIECSGWFVPSQIGINPHDPRNLSWRLKFLRVGGCVVADHRRDPVLLSADDHAAVRGVNLVAYVRAESGVGEAARSWAKAATAACVPYSLTDVGYQNPNLQRDDAVVADAAIETFDVDLLYVNADQTPATLEFIKRRKPAARATIGFWHWEQPELPARLLGAFDGLTEVWTPSAFVQDAIARVAPVPVFKVPHAIEFAVSPGVSRAQFGLPGNRFLVLLMYDFRSYWRRKNPEAGIEAFRRAFPPAAAATLVVKTVNGGDYPEQLAQLRELAASAGNMMVLDEYLTRQQIYDLESLCDCMLSLHRAEGFGLGLAEMMYLGKPVVATGWSGNMEFMTPMNSCPVEYELRRLAETDGAYEAGPEWAEADTGHAATCLRRLAEDAAFRDAVGRRAAQSVRAGLSPLAVGVRIRKRLSHLAWGMERA